MSRTDRTHADELGRALQYHQAGQFLMAEPIYRKILAANPDHADALHLLGVLAHQVGRHDIAIELIGRAIRNNPRAAHYHDNMGNAYTALGRLEEAVSSYRRALEIKPDYAGACNNLANALKALGRPDEAFFYYERAVTLKPDMAEAYCNLGNLSKDRGETDEAIRFLDRAIALNPGYAEAYYSLGLVLYDQGKADEALARYRQAVNLKPDYAEAYNNLGIALFDRGETEEAISCYRKALAVKPDMADVCNNLGNALKSLGRMDEAMSSFLRTLEIEPGYAEAYYSLGLVLYDQGKADEALARYRQAVNLKPDYAEAYNGLGVTLHARKETDEAIGLYRQAIALKQDQPEAHNNLGVALHDQGKTDEAILHYKKALELKPDYGDAHSNYLMALHYDGKTDREGLFREAMEWSRRHCRPPASPGIFANKADPERTLRIGYVSGDFRRHPVGFFMEAVLAHHERHGFEVTCYSNRHGGDDLTRRLRSLPVQWRSIAGVPDGPAEKAIRDDGIDILIDLSGHSAGHRLVLFSRRPAPVQATWIGYFDTTAVPAMDYIISDRYVIPEGEERFYTEKPARLPNGYLCYTPHAYAPEVKELPFLTRGHITFGCFNNVSKVNPAVIETWSRILTAVPGSRLCFRSPALSSPSVREAFMDMFHRNGIEGHRIELSGPMVHKEYLAYYGNIDIILDTFPFAGNTTTADALWMGVPVPTLVHESFPGRFGLSMLSTVGLHDLIAYSPDEYVAVVAGLAGDVERLSALRSGLRGKMEQSPLCDGERFTRDLEKLYRDMWTKWCGEEA